MLEIDKSHKKIDLSSIDMRKAKEIGVKIEDITLKIFMLSGYNKKKRLQEVLIEDNEESFKRR